MILAAILELVSTGFLIVYSHLLMIKFLSIFMGYSKAIKTIVISYMFIGFMFIGCVMSLGTSFLIETDPGYWHNTVINLSLSHACENGPLWHYALMPPALLIDLLWTYFSNWPHLWNGAFLTWHLIVGICFVSGTAGVVKTHIG